MLQISHSLARFNNHLIHTFSAGPTNNTTEYDVALSFAGSSRNYVRRLATFLKHNDIKVFFDEFEQTDLWGKNLYQHLNEIYKKSISNSC